MTDANLLKVALLGHSDSHATPALRPVLSPKLSLGPGHLCLCLVLGVVFMTANYVGLRATDLWCHVAFGEWIAAHGALPGEDPFLPLSEGMPIIDPAWLSQLALHGVHEAGGGEWLSTLFAGLVLATFVVLARVFYLRSGSVGLTVLGLLLVLGVGWSRMWTLRPETAAGLCLALLLWLIARTPALSAAPSDNDRRGKAILLIGVPLLFVVWANLHGSFVCGLAILGCYLLGSAVSAFWRTNSLLALWRDPVTRRWLVITELAVLATLINPYGMGLLVNSALFSGNENLRDVLEWQSLSFGGVGGVEFGLSLVLWMAVFRLSRRRVQPAEVLLLTLFGLATASGIRMISWYAPVAVFLMTPHLANIAARRRAIRERKLPSADKVRPWARRSWKYSMACLLVLWLAFSLSPASEPLLGQGAASARGVENLYRETPLELAKYLRQHPPEGQVWNPQHWGDWLLVHAPGCYSPFVTTMIHHTPNQVWRDYQRVYNAFPSWRNVLERYRVTTVIIDKKNQPLLTPAIRRAENWRVSYEDDDALVMTRKDTSDSH